MTDPEATVRLWADLSVAQRYEEIVPLLTPELLTAFTQQGSVGYAERRSSQERAIGAMRRYAIRSVRRPSATTAEVDIDTFYPIREVPYEDTIVLKQTGRGWQIDDQFDRRTVRP